MANPESIIKNGFAPAMNSHNIEKVMQYFDDNAVVNFTQPPPGMPNTLKGKNEIRKFVETMISGFHGEPRDFKTDGDKVEWTGKVSSDMLKNFGVDSSDAKVSAVIRNDKIVAFNPSFPDEVTRKFQQMQGQGSGFKPSQR